MTIDHQMSVDIDRDPRVTMTNHPTVKRKIDIFNGPALIILRMLQEDPMLFRQRRSVVCEFHAERFVLGENPIDKHPDANMLSGAWTP